MSVGAATAPNAEFTVSPDYGKAPLLVSVDASKSVSKNGKLVKYVWEWGDGSANGSGLKTSHTFAAGLSPYTIRLIITD